MLAGLTAFALSIVATGLIHHAWRSADAAWAAVAGWLLAFGSAFVWSLALGPEIGATYAIMVFVCLIWMTVAWTVEMPKAAGGSDPRPVRRMYRPGARDYARQGAMFLLSVPAAGVVAMMLSVALVLYLPWTMTLKFAVAIFLYPLLWGALSAWVCAQDALVRPALVSLGLFVLASLLLFI